MAKNAKTTSPDEKAAAELADTAPAPAGPAAAELGPIAIVQCARGHKGLVPADLVVPHRCAVNGCAAKAVVIA